MSALARIRKTALQHEQERQYDKALALYARLLDGAEAGEEEVDVALFNRAGDLALRLGDTPRALGYFERALDLYAAGGLLNNAVALGAKILRHAPAHLSAHYTLGVLYGRKGFAADARHHLLTYAVQMQRAGRPDEAGRVLGEVATGCLDAGERRAALDGYGALGGDPAQAAVLTDVPPTLTSTLATSAPGAAGPVPVTWGAVDFDLAPEMPAMLAAEAAETPAWGEPLLLDEVTFEGGTFDAVDRRLPMASGATELPLPVADDAPAWTLLALEPVALDSLAFDAPGGTTAAPPTQGTVGEGTAGTEQCFALDVDEALGDGGGPSLVFLELDADELVGAPPPGASVTSAMSNAFAHEPPPLRLAELLRLQLGASVDLSVACAVPWAAPIAPPVAEAAPHAAPDAAPSDAVDEELVDLGAWLRETEAPATTRLTTASVPQTGDEQADFDATLRVFTAGVSRAVEVDDWDSHYDLGVAFREMGLLDEAIVEFQRAARAPGGPLRALEALAQCFLDVGQPALADSTLAGPAAAAAADGTGDAALVAVHYLLGATAQALGRPDDARRWFVRVVATDVRFRDAATRLAALPPPSPIR